jgi:hypothetical protein
MAIKRIEFTNGHRRMCGGLSAVNLRVLIVAIRE